jgi:hypothetical protein
MGADILIEQLTIVNGATDSRPTNHSAPANLKSANEPLAQEIREVIPTFF